MLLKKKFFAVDNFSLGLFTHLQPVAIQGAKEVLIVCYKLK